MNNWMLVAFGIAALVAIASFIDNDNNKKRFAR